MGKFLLGLLLILISGFFLGCSAENILDKQYYAFGVNLNIGIVLLVVCITKFII